MACIHGSWSDWGPCSASCGSSEQVRTRKTPNGCEPPKTETRACSLTTCCDTGQWSDWSDCKNCDERERKRTFLDEVAESTEACSGIRLLETKDCSDECEECQTGPWIAQSDCTVSCGYGTQNEARDVKNSSPSAPCTAAPATREATCYAGPCPCVPQNWYNDGGCSVSSNCGVGTQFQRRDLVGDCAESTLKAREIECTGESPCACEDAMNSVELKAAMEISPAADYYSQQLSELEAQGALDSCSALSSAGGCS